MRKINRKIMLAPAVFLAVALQGSLALAALSVDEVPTFQLCAHVASVAGKEPEGKEFTFSFAGATATVEGSAWSEWLPFDQAQVEKALGGYPNSYLGQFPLVTSMSVSGVEDPTVVEGWIWLESTAQTTTFSAELFGPSLQLLVWRDENNQPHVATSAEYNRRYWEALKTVSIPEAQRPKQFPIVDRFIGGSSDRREWEQGITALSQAGISAILLNPDAKIREILLKTGLRRTAWRVYNPPGYAFDYSPEKSGTTPEAINAWAESQAKPYLDAGYAREDMALFGISDEPGWYYPSMFKSLTDDPVALQRFRNYIRAQGLTAQDVGATSWDDVLPLGRSKATDLPSRRLFYWTMRFFAWDSSRHFAVSTRALEKAFYPNLPIHTNWNYFNGRLYVPGPVANNADKQSTDAAMGGHDWLEFGRMRGCTMLWTEDWFGDQQAYQWSFYSAKLRCAAEKGGVEFGGYVIPRTAGSRQDGIMQKILTIVGSGGKGIQYFEFGPEYNFPGNCYSENIKVLPKMAETHAMIGAAEDVLWPGRRPRPEVAILAPRSAEMWDCKDIPIPDNVVYDATNTNLNAATVDYMAEVFDLYLALQHANIPVDFVEEEDLTAEGLKPYKVLYVTEPNIPREGQKELWTWVNGGGTLVTVTGAGARDRYDDSCAILGAFVRTIEQPRERMLVPNLGALHEVGTGTGQFGPFSAFGPRGFLAGETAAKVLAKFDDGSPAMLEGNVGKGAAVHFTWMPGLSYVKSSTRTKDLLPVGFSESIRAMIVYPTQRAKVTPPVVVDRPMVETPLLLSEKGAAVTLLNWTGEPIERLNVTVRVPFKVRSVESVKQGTLAFQEVDGGISCALPLGAADILVLHPH